MSRVRAQLQPEAQLDFSPSSDSQTGAEASLRRLRTPIRQKATPHLPHAGETHGREAARVP